jgi:N-glycosylase/DNA lyase
MVVCALDGFQLKGSAEDGYWGPIQRLILSAPVPESDDDLAGILRPFLARERIPTTKLDRLSRYLTSELAAETANRSARDTATRLSDFHSRLAETMRQKDSDKTIVYAVKCLILGLRILGVPDVPVPDLAVPVDGRVRGLTHRIGLLGADCSANDVRACWASILTGLRGRAPSVTMVELDSLLWQGAKWRAPEEVARWLVNEHGVKPQIADRIGRLFHGSPDVRSGEADAVDGRWRRKAPSLPHDNAIVSRRGAPD